MTTPNFILAGAPKCGTTALATYLRQHDTNEIMEDFEVYAKKHPTQTLVGAVVAGFLLGRLLR